MSAEAHNKDETPPKGGVLLFFRAKTMDSFTHVPDLPLVAQAQQIVRAGGVELCELYQNLRRYVVFPVSYFEYPVCDICKYFATCACVISASSRRSRSLGYMRLTSAPVFHNLKQIIFGLYSNSGGKLAYGDENRRPVMGRRF